MKLYGTTGKVDDSAIPYDRSVTKDLPIRPMLPFCVDISMCPNIEIEKRMKRYFQVTHESGNVVEDVDNTLPHVAQIRSLVIGVIKTSDHLRKTYTKFNKGDASVNTISRDQFETLVSHK